MNIESDTIKLKYYTPDIEVFWHAINKRSKQSFIFTKSAWRNFRLCHRMFCLSISEQISVKEHLLLSKIKKSIQACLWEFVTKNRKPLRSETNWLSQQIIFKFNSGTHERWLWLVDKTPAESGYSVLCSQSLDLSDDYHTRPTDWFGPPTVSETGSGKEGNKSLRNEAGCRVTEARFWWRLSLELSDCPPHRAWGGGRRPHSNRGLCAWGRIRAFLIWHNLNTAVSISNRVWDNIYCNSVSSCEPKTICIAISLLVPNLIFPDLLSKK